MCRRLGEVRPSTVEVISLIMAALDDLDRVIEQCQRALREFIKGNPEPMQMMFSHREDVTLANPIAPPARGWDEVAQTM